MALADLELQIGELVLGSVGGNFIVHRVEGLGTPDWRTSDVERPQDHGSFYGSDYLDVRMVGVFLTIRGDTPAETAANLDVFKREWFVDSRTNSQATKELRFKLPGHEERVLIGRPRQVEVDTSRLLGHRVSVAAQFVAADPRQYSAEEHTVHFSLATDVAGRGFPKSFPYGWGGSGSSGVEQINNAGNFTTPLVVRFHGPVLNPFIENQTTGERLTLNIAINEGDYIEVDFSARTVMLNSFASRYYAKSGTFWELQPGVNHVRFGASAASEAASASLTWRDAWI